MGLIRAAMCGTHKEDGQGLAEYALILVLIAIVLLATLIILGNDISALLTGIGQSV
jgi:pilus assembly protein Flp/PilA